MASHESQAAFASGAVADDLALGNLEKRAASATILDSSDGNSASHADANDGTFVLDDGLRRGLKGRHFVLIALGSIIGPGTYYGLGYALYLSGPLGSLIGFSVVGVAVWILMQSVGETTAMFPVHGGFIEHSNRFVDPALSFALAWLYYLMWSIYLPADWNAASLILEFWVPSSTMPSWAWYLIFWAFFSVLTTLGVGVYGELEYVFGMFKFCSLIVLFFISILADVGAFGQPYMGFYNWKPPQGPIINGINGFGQVFILAAAYYVGTEIISLAAGESKNPQRDVPKSMSSITYRIVVVYIGMAFFQGLICPSDADALIHAGSKVASSPFTIGFVKAGWKTAGHFVNALIVVAFVSAGNGVVYVQSRTLFSMAKTGKAPRIFAKTSKKGVPYIAVLVSNLWGFLACMNMSIDAGTVFSYFTSVGGTAAYFTWIIIMITFLRVRRAMQVQGIPLDTLPFQAPGNIWMYRLNFAFFIFLLIVQGFTSFVGGFHYKVFISSYITIPTFIVLYFGYKWYHKTRWLRAHEIPLGDRKVFDPALVGRKRKGWKGFLEILRD